MPVLDVPPPRHGTYGLLASAIGASTPSNGTARDMTFAQPDFMSAKERMRSPNGSSTIMMTPRFGIVLETMRQTGFDDFEDMAVAYYTSQFEWGSVPAMLQSVSRSRRLKPMLHELSQNSKKWPRWQSRGLQESISRAAVTLPERMSLIVLQSSWFVSSDKEAIRNEEWDQGSGIKIRVAAYLASYRKSKEAVLCRFTRGFQIFT
ncbi:unnamed protein product [Alternaria alternata]